MQKVSWLKLLKVARKKDIKSTTLLLGIMNQYLRPITNVLESHFTIRSHQTYRYIKIHDDKTQSGQTT